MAAEAPDTVASASVLRTKLHAPGRRPGTIERSRLMDRAARSSRPKLTLVSAPAGFGKTTLLTSWFVAGDAGSDVAWLSLDARDDDPVSFWTYVVAAIRTVLPEVGGEAMTALGTAPSRTVVESLLADLDLHNGEFLLVLDDYHVIESPEIHDGMALLLEHLPPGVGVVMATRVDPPIPLARMRARGELVERRAADLRFTGEEAARYFAETMGLALSGADVEALESRTEGWIAALQLAALSLQGREDVGAFIESFTGDDRFVVDYLVEEVLERQRPELRQFLLRTSVLSRLTGSLCDAVTGGEGGRATLEQIDRANLFLVPLDDRRQWYRYHHLFGDVLRARLLDDDRELVTELHRRAAIWWADHDDPVEAITHAVSGRDTALAADLIELATPELQRSRQEGLLSRWLDALPREVFDDRPVLCMALVGARMASGDIEQVEAVLDGIEEWLRPDRRQPGEPIVIDHDQFERLPVQVAVQRAGLALLAGDLEAVAANADRALSLAAPDDHVRRGSATALHGLAAWAAGDLESARSFYADAVELLTRGGHLADALGCSLGLADMCIAQGRLRAAEEALHRGLNLVRDHPGLRGEADMHVGLAEVLLERNELDRAREELAAAERLGERAGLPQHPYRWRLVTARVRQAEGDTATAAVLLRDADRHYNTDYSPASRPIAAFEARLRVVEGEPDAALRWAERSRRSVDDPLSYVAEFEHLTLAHALVAVQVRDRADRGAVAFLEGLLAAAGDGGRTGVVVECLALLAMAHQAVDDRAGALQHAERALALGADEGLVRVFLDLGPSFVSLLRSASFDGVAAAHVRVVLGAATGSARVGATAGLVDELSGRELEVLRLLRSELSGPDIARELIVSLNTVRTHTKNIYAKLGVGNRREAIRRADELGLT